MATARAFQFSPTMGAFAGLTPYRNFRTAGVSFHC